eukprot:TRINITY_DN1001_c0_g2_i11.p1 TRINITY_DN1001_c0_g2~~TRINITY_DN1001_c0_g2_i11.p1  ORF type:complete len:478 (-),score=136.42 TRINITY_DN1001_c0_g2_i11:169-1602(-)
MPELCYMTGLSEAMRKDFNVMKQLATVTRLDARARAGEISAIVSQRLLNNPEGRSQLNEFGITLSSTFLQVPARRLAPERVFFKQTAVNVNPNSANWGNELSRNPPISVYSPGSVLLVFSARVQNAANELIPALTNAARMVGLQMNFVPCPLQYDRKDDYVRTLASVFADPAQAQAIRLVMCIMPGEDKDKYSAIKQTLTVDFPVPSQCILLKSLNPAKLNTVCQRVALQIVCKLGGELWAMDIPLKDTMICGIDVCHSRGKSVVALVGTINPRFTKYYAGVDFHEKGQEVSVALRKLMSDTLRGYFGACRALPLKIIVYRDGVGDGMLKQVLDVEVAEYVKAFTDFPAYKPQLTIVVVKKRIHTRLFLNNWGNPGPGTVIDEGCTHKGWYDFYVVSNSVTQGTVTPTHYHVIRDDIKLTEHQMQLLTYKLTHMYYNWPGTIRVPAPCQYAHKLAFLVGQSTHRIPAPALCDKLFFL